MRSDNKPTKPSIIICTAVLQGYEYKLRELRAGMEEEGIPYSLQRVEGSDAVSLAYQGANTSELGVGVGISQNKICIHFKRLPPLKPLFTMDSAGTLDEWRHFGFNAARLVKGLPFKAMPGQGPVIDSEEADLYELVRKIVLKVLQESAEGQRE
ncbi:glycerol dehydratase reactivase beta/small subunit family protein [Desulforamulus aquiferis]|nr:glycerol dehydratase reactivase beta/small subunit family protein [Desulforamulus aquiferis]